MTVGPVVWPERRLLDPGVAQRLRQCRVQAGISLRGLARKVGLSHSFLLALERGLRAPTKATATTLIEALSMPPDLAGQLRLAAVVKRAYSPPSTRGRAWKPIRNPLVGEVSGAMPRPPDTKRRRIRSTYGRPPQLRRFF